MATLEQICQYTINVLGEAQRRLGDATTPISTTTVGNPVVDIAATLADNFGVATLWQTTQAGLTSPSQLLFLTDADVVLELAATTPNPDERVLFFVKANQPLMLSSGVVGGYASDTTRLAGTNLVAPTHFNPILQIRCQRNVATGVGAANVRLILFS